MLNADGSGSPRRPLRRSGGGMTPPPSKDQLREYYARKLAGMGESLDGLGGDAAPEPPAVEEKRKVGKVSFADPEGGDGGGAGGRSPRLARGNKPAMLSLGGAGKAPVSLSSNSNDESEFTSDGSVVSPVRAADLDSEHPDSGDAVKHLRRKLSPAITPLRIARNVHTPPGDSPTELLPPMKGLALKRGRKPPPLASSASEPILSTRNLQLHDDDAGYKSFDESDDEKSIATTYSESLSSLPPTTNYPRTGTIRRTPSSQLRRRKSMADKKLLIPLHGQPTFQPGTYDPAEIPLPNPLELNDTVLEVVRVLGYGNSGVVSLVRHIQTGQLYAKKVIPLQLDRPRFLRHMYRALSILALNKSPFLIGFVGCYLSQQPDPDTQFAEASICLEFMDLPNVQDAVPILRPTPCFLEFIRQATRAVLGAMEYLYEGFRAVHRDIKPANVLINSAGEIKLADLGELGTLGDEGYARTFVGTGGYMAPERIKPPAAGGGYSVQADVWSLGVMIVELITGNHPYDLEARAKERAEEGMSPIVGEAETPRPEQVDRLDPNELLAIPGRSETMSSFGSGSGASEAYESYGSSGGEGSLSEIPSAVLSSGSPRMTPATAPAILQNRPELTFLDLSADSPDSADRMARRPSTQRAGSLDAARDGMPSPPRPLVEQASVFDLLDAIVNGPVPSIPDTVDVSIELRSFLARCLDKDPSKRGKPGELARHPWLAGAEGKVPADCLAILLEEKKRKEAEE